MAMLGRISKRINEALVRSCRNFYGESLVSVVVFGSVARGTQTYHSDFDILIIADNLPRGRMARMRDFDAVEHDLAGELDYAREQGWNVDIAPLFKTPDEVRGGGYLYLDMVNDAVILVDRNDFFALFLDSYKAKLEAYGAQKHQWRGGYYWEIKPDLKPGEVIDL